MNQERHTELITLISKDPELLRALAIISGTKEEAGKIITGTSDDDV